MCDWMHECIPGEWLSFCRCTFMCKLEWMYDLLSLCVREYHSVHLCEYMCECECMWVCQYASDCKSRSLCLPVCKHIFVCDWVNIHVHVCMFIHVNMWTWRLSDLQVYIWAYLFQWIYKYVSVRAYSCVSECEYIRSFVWI